METRTVYDQRRVSRFNIYLICILSIVLTIQGFVSMGKDFGIKAGIATGTASIVVVLIYFLTSWGNEYLERALEQEEEARRILANLRKLVEENSQVSDSLNKNLEISNRQTQEISAAVEIQDSNIAALAQGFGEARAISEGLKDSLDLDSI